jgi:uncharacterized protein (DUF2141 family)
MNKTLITFICLTIFSQQLISQKVDQVNINFSNLRNDIGVIRVGFYKNNASFKQETPFLKKSFQKDNLLNGQLLVNVTLPFGIYGIAILDDENLNGKMDYSFLIPKEGYGFSNYIHSGFLRPSFDDFKFIVDSSNNNIQITVKYF